MGLIYDVSKSSIAIFPFYLPFNYPSLAYSRAFAKEITADFVSQVVVRKKVRVQGHL